MLDELKALENSHQWASLTINGHDWRWIDTEGTGPVIVLLPGSVGDAGMFALTVRTLEQKARVLAITYPSLSDPHLLSDGLIKVLDHVKVTDAIIVGSSFAAYWAQFIALRYPGRVKHLVIGNGFVDGTDLTENPLFDPDYVENVTPDALHQKWLQRIETAPVSDLQQLQTQMLKHRQTPENLHARFLGVVRAKPCPNLPLEGSKVTILDCADDPLIPLKVRERLRNNYPQAHHITLRTGGHYPHLLNPNEYSSILTTILKSNY
jgi:pimeloyl-ACP methyl ester carboxylesterase